MPLDRYDNLRLLSTEVRRRALATICSAGTGHLGGCSSAAELLTVLYLGGHLRYDVADPDNPGRDLVLIRGHVGAVRYGLFALLGWLDDAELDTYRRLGSRLQGHEAMGVTPGVDITPSGSLGMLLSYGVGAAYSRTVRGLDSKVVVFVGDGEEQEGMVAEAARHAAAVGIGNLVAIIDRNGKQLSGPTSAFDATDVPAVWDAYGWDVHRIVDAHSVAEVDDVFRSLPRASSRPVAVVADSIKGFGLPGAAEHPSGFHTISTCGRGPVMTLLGELEKEIAASPTTVEDALAAAVADIPPPPVVPHEQPRAPFLPTLDRPMNMEANTALGEYVLRLVDAAHRGESRPVYLFTADWLPTRFKDELAAPRDNVHFVDVGVREQHMVGMAHGVAVSEPGADVVVLDADFLAYRAADQLHAAAQVDANILFVGLDAGVSGGTNGSTHQSTGQPAMMLGMAGVTCWEAGDAADLFACLNAARTARPGVRYVRSHAVGCEPRVVAARSGPSYVAHQPSVEPALTIVTAGATLDGAVDLAVRAEKHGLGIVVVNVVEPSALDRRFVALLPPERPVLVAYNGHARALESAVAIALVEHGSAHRWRVRATGFGLGTSGPPRDLLAHFGLDAKGLLAKALEYFPDIRAAAPAAAPPTALRSVVPAPVGS